MGVCLVGYFVWDLFLAMSVMYQVFFRVFFKGRKDAGKAYLRLFHFFAYLLVGWMPG